MEPTNPSSYDKSDNTGEYQESISFNGKKKEEVEHEDPEDMTPEAMLQKLYITEASPTSTNSDGHRVRVQSSISNASFNCDDIPSHNHTDGRPTHWTGGLPGRTDGHAGSIFFRSNPGGGMTSFELFEVNTPS